MSQPKKTPLWPAHKGENQQADKTHCRPALSVSMYTSSLTL
jgi:hypothetical protein